MSRLAIGELDTQHIDLVYQDREHLGGTGLMHQRVRAVIMAWFLVGAEMLMGKAGVVHIGEHCQRCVRHPMGMTMGARIRVGMRVIVHVSMLLGSAVDILVVAMVGHAMAQLMQVAVDRHQATHEERNGE